ncbi:cytochrome c biogenesis protein ResB [Nocardioides marmoriginsengisoli]|uniref:Cytochrome c biogenesis protein ResB n=1 Tax=Nocardioides marmoriginsengisoli TaxID=661483 RepID=A0A3N0CFN8_9ACTN|nr:cytochrome c biogenesis protein ResB [Nocardioides marmoriginsengisoli]RNL62280.1 cytochrome c biogenesis protein ResB [Nocardioides marmoriginsengisoli]
MSESPDERPDDAQYENARDRAATVAPLAPREFLRWTWRQLTSMRTALILLFLLALGAVPGSVVPQNAVDSLAAARWRDQHPSLTPIYEKLGMFNVYSSPWFSAIYILLMVSLVGCILPRTRVYLRAMRARPPKAPRNLARLPEHRTFTTDQEPDEVLRHARAALRGYRVDLAGPVDGTGSIAAERGYLREAGNLLFHVSVLVVLVGFAVGSLLGYKGGVLVVTGGQFANVSSQYDEFTPGSLFSVGSLEPFSFKVTDFDVTFDTGKRNFGLATDFSAGLSYKSSPNGEVKTARISVNHPLSIDGTKVFLIGHGYAPDITVRDTEGNVEYSGPVIFLPEDTMFRSSGVIKVPDASPKQLGFRGEFYPTTGFSMETGPTSVFPDAKLPLLSMQVYAGDLGLDDGIPQSVYALNTDNMKPVQKDGKDFRVDLAPGKGIIKSDGSLIPSTVTLPDGLGTITFNGVSRFVKLQISKNPADGVALAGVVLALLGLLGSLFIKPRRIWVSARREGGRTVVEVAGLDRSAGGDLSGVVDDLAGKLENRMSEDKA